MIEPKLRSSHKKGIAIQCLKNSLIAIFSAAMVIFFLIKTLNSGFDDWYLTYAPACQTVLRGQSPYWATGFINPPWTLLILTPFSFLPNALLRISFSILALVCLAFAAYRIKAPLLSIALFVFSPPVLRMLQNANIDWLSIIGFIIPPVFGLFFISIKPQNGIAIAFYLLVEAWHEGRIKSILRRFYPLTLSYMLSFVVFGFWLLAIPNKLIIAPNISIFPYGVPIGLALAYCSVRFHRIELSILASPFLSPYFNIHSIPVLMFGLLPYRKLFYPATASLWVIHFFVVPLFY